MIEPCCFTELEDGFSFLNECPVTVIHHAAPSHIDHLEQWGYLTPPRLSHHLRRDSQPPARQGHTHYTYSHLASKHGARFRCAHFTALGRNKERTSATRARRGDGSRATRTPRLLLIRECFTSTVGALCVYDKYRACLVIGEKWSCRCGRPGERSLRFGSRRGPCGRQVRRAASCGS